MDIPRPRIGILEFAESVLGYRLYRWQKETLLHIACGHPMALATANSAGKSTVILGTAILWFLLNYPRGRCPITSGSWLQLEEHLMAGLRAHSAHPLFRSWEFLTTEIRTGQGGVAIGFSTDEANRVEGWHSRLPDSPVFYVVDEAKAVPDKLFEGIDRCDVTFKILASSTGLNRGKFYRCFNESRSGYWTRRVPWTECPHITEGRRQSFLIDHSEESALYRSTFLAEFIDDEGSSIVSPAFLRANLERPPTSRPGKRVAFCDFAAGGDENVIAVADGNRCFLAGCWREADTVQATRQFIREFERLKLLPGSIYGDEGGLGTVMIDSLAESRWRINRVNNGKAARREIYANTGAEVWFEAARAIKNREYILPEDPVFLRQAVDRRVEYSSTQKLRAESKESMRARGVASPDRADALFGAMLMAWPGYGSGGIDLATLAGISIGGGRALFDGEPVRFE